VLFHPEGDLEMARGASQADTLYVSTGVPGWPVETVATAAPGPKMFQLYHLGDRSWVAELLARVEGAGYRSVILTVDVQVYGRRERDLRARFNPREAMAAKTRNPRGPDPTYPARLTWDDVEWLRKATRLPVGLKGILTARDAQRAIQCGVQLVWVSNHGGRQLDQTQATIDALPEIVDAVGGAADIVIDGGFSRGTHVVKALALGATVVAVGRTILWGLAAAGAAGVARTLEILRDEIRTALALSGQTSATKLAPDLVFRVD
jgi:isopentenyl diphosphate isomerase/L-lactate dehydrogenase-like FMN-dependent dehydrogenase